MAEMPVSFTSTSSTSTLIQADHPDASEHPRVGAHAVFISHHGIQMKRQLADHIYHALTQRGISTFLDRGEIPNADDAGPFMLEAAQRARVGVPIFSSSYAESSGCLDELVLLMKSKRSGNAVVVPVYYDARPEDLRKKDGKDEPYAKALEAHRRKGTFSEERIKGWESALREASWLGSTLRLENYNKFEGEFVLHIVKEVSEKLQSFNSVDRRLVGIEERVEEVLELLQLNDEEKVHLVLLWGMGGVGKTTLAKAIYKILNAKEFQAASCFVEKCGDKDSKQIQSELLKQLLLEENVLDLRMEECLRHGLMEKKVLVVLDDVKDCSSIEEILDSVTPLKQGSRILLTSRDQRAWGYFSEDFSTELYNVKCLDPNQSLQLFCLHAFRMPSPRKGFERVAEEAMSACHGLPLSLQVLGRHLRATKEEYRWNEAIEKLHRSQHEGVVKVLMISYEALDKNEQEMFLDVACFLIGKCKRTAKYFWDCGRSGIEILVERSLLEVDENRRFAMHDHLRDLGRRIVEDEYEKSGRCSRLWARCPFANQVLESEQGLDQIRGLADIFLPSNLITASLSHMRSLQLLFLTNSGVHGGDIEGLKQLRIKWLEMNGIPPKELCSDSLTVLQFRLWSQFEPLKSIPFSCGKMKSLRKLKMPFCRELTELPEDFGSLECLSELVVSYSTITKLPSSFTQLKHLWKLSMAGCKNLKELPEDFGSLESLKVLKLCGTGIAKLPSSFGQLRKLRELRASDCEGLKELCEDFGSLESLDMLDLSMTGIAKLPSSFGQLRKLREFRASRCEGLKDLCEDFGSLESLEVLDLTKTGIAKLPFSFGQLRKLRELRAYACKGLKELCEDFGSLQSLEVLELNITGIAKLPSFFGQLRKLRELSVGWCEGLKELCEDFGSLESLEVLDISWTGIAKLPSSFGHLKKLRELYVAGCRELKELPENLIGFLENLEYLDL